MNADQLSPIPDRRAIAAGAVFAWIAVAPWAWGFSGAHSAVANHVALLFGFGPLSLLIANLRAAAIAVLLGAIWLVASPWVLGYASDHLAWLNELVSGGALVVLSAHAADFAALRRDARLSPQAGAVPFAGAAVERPQSIHKESVS